MTPLSMLNPGAKLGAYEIVSVVGAGGMGEVYRARDTRLDRTVAIKVLATHLSTAPELKQRFEREARAISSLNHPRICQLYDVGSQNGTDYLVMEFLEGETLAEHLEKGALPLKETLKIGMEVAEALGVAHRSGIIHRDLKPGNIMLTGAGAKLMDFGLAKPATAGVAAGAATAPVFSAALTASSPSPAGPLSSAGMIVGTMQYMSPEQIQGQEADARSDVFALGAVLYEMATGKRAFEGKSQISVASAILEKDPEPISAIKPLIQPAFEYVVKSCLEKSPEERFQTAHDVKLQLSWISAASSASLAAMPGVKPRGKRRYRLMMAAAILAAAAAVAAAITAVLLSQRLQRAERPLTAEISLPSGEGTFTEVGAGPPAISPDGSKLAYTASGGNAPRLYVRDLATGRTTSLEGADGASFVFWSPDSQNLGFFANGKLQRIAAGGGPVQTICDAPDGRGGSWNAEGTIIFAPSFQGPLYRVREAGGTPQKLTEAKPGWTQRDPYFLPDGDHFLFLAFDTKLGAIEGAVYAGSLKGGEPELLLQQASNVQLSRDYLLYFHGSNLLAQRFNLRSLSMEGDPIPVAERLDYSNLRALAFFAASPEGMLVYKRAVNLPTRPVLVDRQGKEVGAFGEPAFHSALGPGGEVLISLASGKAAFVRDDPGTSHEDVWVVDTKRNISSRATFSDFINIGFALSPDGNQLAVSGYGSAGKTRISILSASGLGNVSELTAGNDFAIVAGWSRDGRYLVGAVQRPKTGMDIIEIDLKGDRKITPIVATPANEASAALSPNGKWLAYESDESGKMEVYVTSFPHPSGKWQVSNGGGSQAHWSADGRELYFLQADKLMAAPVHSSATFDVGSPALVFTPDKDVTAIVPGPTPDHFVELKTTGSAAPEPLQVVQNWTGTLRK